MLQPLSIFQPTQFRARIQADVAVAANRQMAPRCAEFPGSEKTVTEICFRRGAQSDRGMSLNDAVHFPIRQLRRMDQTPTLIHVAGIK